MEDKRSNIVDLVKNEIYGPIDIDSEETISDNPLSRYYCGVLYPQHSLSTLEEGDDCSKKDDSTSLEADEVQTNSLIGHQFSYKDLTENDEECLNLSNAYKQSALSVSVCINLKRDLRTKITFATYRNLSNPYQWKRTPFSKDFCFSSADLIQACSKTLQHSLYEDTKCKLTLYVFFRWKTDNGDFAVLTFSVVNETKNAQCDNRYPNANESFFQVQINLVCDSGFAPISKEEKFVNPNEDTMNNELIFRNEKEYAVGHGCSPVWDDRHNKLITAIHSEFLPTYEIKAIIPTDSSTLGITLLMKEMYEDKNGENTFSILESLCDSYANWIGKQKASIASLEQCFIAPAEANIRKCEECLKRMREGCQLLRDNKDAFLAFRLMNKAMLLQQLHSKLPKRSFSWKKYPDKLELESITLPDFDNEKTWPLGFTFGSWRAFQIGFILLSIKSIVDHSSPERGFVDLIWFPTGGGKTEAYLGLSSFTIFYKRIMKTDDGSCVQIFMRYTLRLLTSQQYERAAALICSMEHMRRENKTLLGDKPISVGLWVGGATTPNTIDSAIESYSKLNSGRREGTDKNPFVLTKCPWCGAEIGSSKGRMYGLKLQLVIQGKRKAKKLLFSCSNPNCDFHVEKDISSSLPLSVIDEELYQNPPTLLIGTVDKFAMLPYRPQAKSLFGLKDGPRIGRSHPELIIQDELHLISGPLGSTVSAYETMIDFLCSYEENGKMIRPKIIASTATISQAKKQCHELYDVPENNVKIFPPSCLDNGETFFSKISEQKAGREYVGIYAPGAPSSASASIHILSAHFEGKRFIDYGENSEQKDAYWTNVCYFNSIRELAQAVNWVDADIFEHSKIILRRDKSNSDYRLKLPKYMELNSRNHDVNIGTELEQLGQKFSDGKGNADSPLDFCFATNMISVGIDIDRLGIMTVFGQPKTTSEYIQATSRVGRSSKRPGLVFTFYNSGKPRDKSIFEAFEAFHSKFYSFVEPTSISPFCSELRSRVIPALLLGMTRFISSDNSDNPRGLLQAYSDGFATIAKSAILKRVNDIDPTETNDTETQIDAILDNWKKQSIDIYNYPFKKNQDLSQMFDESAPAICPDSDYFFIPDSWRKATKAAPTSMRNVDLNCKFEINSDYDGGINYGQN